MPTLVRGLRVSVRVAALSALAFALGCATPAPTTRPAAAGQETELAISPEAERRAEELLEAAVRVEPELTALLQMGAERLDVLLVGLEYRVKSRASLERKIQTEMLASGKAAEAIEITDVVRYTVLLDDEPPGDYDRTTADILRRAEGRGHEVLEVKNYWPPGDTYSGVNSVLRSPEGLPWELQFHTIGSLAAKDEGHPLYEELRLPTIPLKRKRAVYDRLAGRWDWVQIPDGVLVEHSLHAREEILFHDRP